MENNLYEFGGTCDVIIRCNSERIIGGKTYKEHEPYTILRDVICNLGYRNIVSERNAVKNVTATRIGLPDIVSLSNVSLTDKVCNLIATQQKESTITKIYETVSDNGKIYLPEEPVAMPFVFSQGMSVENFTINGDILVGDFIDDVGYLIIYEVQTNNKCFDFTTPMYGYFSLEIIGKGNQNKISDNLYMKFPAVSLMSVPAFDLINGSVLHAPLQFECIHQRQENAYFNIGG